MMTSALKRLDMIGMLLIVLTCSLAALADEPETLTGKVTEVTLYQGQALVTRSITIPDVDAGPVEVVVGPLPAAVVQDSLFAEGGEHTAIRAVRFRQRSVSEAPGEKLRELQEAERDLNWRRKEVQAKLSLLQHRDSYLTKLEKFTAPAATAEMSKGVLNAESLIEISNYNFEKRQDIEFKRLEVTQEADAINREMAEIQKQMRELTGGSGRIEREAVVFVDHRGNGPLEFDLNYLVGNCGWKPAYTLRADSKKEQVSIEYTAMIRQVSGEDWNNVKLRLSSASAALSSAAPTLSYFAVDLQQAAPAENQQMQSPNISSGSFQFRGQLKDINDRRDQLLGGQKKAISREAFVNNSYALNQTANDLQLLEVMAGEELTQAEAVASSPLSFSYELKQPVSVDSRADQQLVRIMQTNLKGELYYLAMPVLSEFVYREALLTNTTGYDLLSGPITTYLDGRFVGRAELGTVAQGQSFVAGFGADPQLRTSRQRIKRDVNVQGANQIVNLEFELKVENFKDQKVTVRVMDRMPYADNASSLKVSLDETSRALSKDEDYRRIERPKNILRWDVTVDADATGPKAAELTFDYTMEFARNLTLQTGYDKGLEEYESFDNLRRQR